MATGTIVFVRESDRGLMGYVADDAIEGFNRTLNVYFDSRCFAASAQIGCGDRVTFEYDTLNKDRNSKPRMKFDSMKLIENQERD